MLLAAYATGATRAFIYLRYEYPEINAILANAIAEAHAANLIGEHILGSDFSCALDIRRGAGAYICGEEGLIAQQPRRQTPLSAQPPTLPGDRTVLKTCPRPSTTSKPWPQCPRSCGAEAAWYRSLGLDGHPGTKVISLSGDVQRPGNYEVPFGLPLNTLLHEWAGGPGPSRQIQAVTMAGISGGFLAGDDLDVTLDEPAIRARGSMLGAGGIMAFDDRRDMVEIARQAMAFFAEESCGKCFPCRIGTQRLTERLGGDGPTDLAVWRDEVTDIGDTMKATSACGLGMAAPFITDSLLKYFPDQVAQRVCA